MVSGMDRYFQIARCFRDEDQRADRQPEFTQLDLEMSFVEQENILNLTETLFTELCREITPHLTQKYTPWRRLTYREAIDRYGSDKPDLRFEMAIEDVSEQVAGGGFGVFANAVAAGGVVRGIKAPGLSGYTRKQLDDLTNVARQFARRGSRGWPWKRARAASSPRAPRSPSSSAQREIAALAVRFEAGAGRPPPLRRR